MDQLVSQLGDFRGRSVLITGHTGFKGSWLALWLQMLGAKVHGFALEPLHEQDHFNVLGLERLIEHQIGDVRDIGALRKAFERSSPEFVFHLAAQPLVRQSYLDPKLTFDVNVGGSINVLECVRNSLSVKSLVYVTSDKCYKNHEVSRPYIEADELGGHDPYSASKAAAEIVFTSYLKSYFGSQSNCGIGSVRAGNVIGGGDWSDDRIIPDCVRALNQGEPIKVRSPLSVRPWQHVLEPIAGYLQLASRLAKSPSRFSGSWNFGPAEYGSSNVITVVESVVKEWGVGSIDISSATDDLHEAGLLHLDCAKAMAELDWRPQWQFARTIAETIAWYKAFSAGEDALKLSMAQIALYEGGL